MDILPQILVNGLLIGSIYGLIALGLSLIYGVLKFMNFAHGEMATIGAYVYYLFFIFLGWNILPSLAMVILAALIAGFLFDKLVFEPLRGECPWTLLVTSIGVSGLIKASLLLIATGKGRSYYKEGIETAVYEFWNGAVIITSYQVAMLITTLTVLISLALFLKLTKTGKAIRAVSDNSQLAAVMGIDVKHTVRIIFLISTVLAAIAGVLIAYEQNLSPNMGLWLSVFAFSAVIVGGLGSVWGAVLGGLALGVVQNLVVGIDWFGYSISTNYKMAVAFGLLILMLLVRPNGLFGSSLEQANARK